MKLALSVLGASAVGAIALVSVAIAQPPGRGLGGAPGSPCCNTTPMVLEARIAAERADARGNVEQTAAAQGACEQARHGASNHGAVLGGVAGAVIGSQVAGSDAKSNGGVSICARRLPVAPSTSRKGICPCR